MTSSTAGTAALDPSPGSDESMMDIIMRNASFKAFHPKTFDENTLHRSMWAVRFGLFADALSTTVLWPNYAFIASPGATSDSFEDTGPFDFAGATYFMPMMSLLAAAVTSCFMGNLSDRFGRRPSMLICVGFSVFLTIGKYLLKDTFWGFSAGLFANGLFAGSLPVALTYASDVSLNRRERDTQMSYMFVLYTVGWRLGGVLTIFLSDYGLFTPLLAGAFVNAVATILLIFYMIEPKEVNVHIFDIESGVDSEDNEKRPQSFNKKTLGTLYATSFLDGTATMGCFPLTMAPLAFDTFYATFAEAGEEPIMTPSVYRWSNVLVGITAFVASMVARPIFQKIGIPAGCILSNIVVTVGPMICLFISNLDPTRTTLAIYMVLVYILYPATIMSQLAISLMLDRISPDDCRGLTQGLNTTLQNMYVAVAPFASGILSDSKGTASAIYVLAGIGVLGILVKTPLFFSDALKTAVASEDTSVITEDDICITIVPQDKLAREAGVSKSTTKYETDLTESSTTASSFQDSEYSSNHVSDPVLIQEVPSVSHLSLSRESLTTEEDYDSDTEVSSNSD